MPSRSTPLPTILIIHGAWHSPLHYRSLRRLLEFRGYETWCPCLPTHNAAPSPPGPLVSFFDDVKLVDIELKRLIEEGEKDVLVLMHSYGGSVGTQAVHEKYGKRARKQKGLAGGVLRLIFMTALLIEEGESIMSWKGERLGKFFATDRNGLCIPPTISPTLFYHDLPLSSQTKYTSLLAPIPITAVQTTLTYTAYKHYPCTYLFCTQDRGLTIGMQEDIVDESGLRGMEGFEEVRCDSGHSPFLSMPERVMEMVDGVS